MNARTKGFMVGVAVGITLHYAYAQAQANNRGTA